MTKDNDSSSEVFDEIELSLGELCRACQLPAERILAFVEEGVVEPQGAEPEQWRFHSLCITRVRRADRLERDLGVNLAGAALALQLLDEIEQLSARLHRLERQR